MDTTPSMTSHREHLEVGELTNLRWQRLQLVLIELKEKDAMRKNKSILHNKDYNITLEIMSQITEIIPLLDDQISII